VLLKGSSIDLNCVRVGHSSYTETVGEEKTGENTNVHGRAPCCRNNPEPHVP
jgi:hypothetical protein